jgi:hypothetical protein
LIPPEEVEFIFEKELSAEGREGWGRLHPHLMGGDLPATEEDEVGRLRKALRAAHKTGAGYALLGRMAGCPASASETYSADNGDRHAP